MAYPTSLDNLPAAHADGTGEVIHATDINNLALAANALETKMGVGTGAPVTTGTVLTVTGAGASAWQALGTDSSIVLSPAVSGGDDSSALNTWLSTLGNKRGRFQAGTYSVGATLNIPAGALIEGWPASGARSASPQTVITKRTGTNALLFTLGTGATIRGLTINGNKANNTTLLTSNSDISISTGSDYAQVIDCHIYNSGFSAVRLLACKYARIADCLIETTADRSIYVDNIAGCDYLTIERNRVMQSGQDGIVVHGAGTIATGCSYTKIINNVVSFAGITATKQQLGIEVYGGISFSDVSHNTIIGPDSATGGIGGGQAGFYGISHDKSVRCTCSNNIITQPNGFIMVGIELADAEGCEVTSNQIYGVSHTGVAGIANAVSVTNGPSGGSSGKENVIANNHIEQCEYGVFAGNDAVALNITGNTFTDCTDGVWLEGGTENSGNADDALIVNNQFRLKHYGVAGYPTNVFGGTSLEAGIKVRLINRAQILGNRFTPDRRLGDCTQVWNSGIILDTAHSCKLANNFGDGRAPSGASVCGQFIALYGDSDDMTIEHNEVLAASFSNFVNTNTRTNRNRFMLNSTHGMTFSIISGDEWLYVNESTGTLTFHGRSNTSTSIAVA